MNPTEDELEQRLRALFTDERLDLPPPPDAERGIVAGARRRRRRRQMALSATGVAAVAVVVAGGLALVRVHSEDGTAVMSAQGTQSSVLPPDDRTPGGPPHPAGPGTVGTGELQASTPAAPAKPSSTVPSTSGHTTVTPRIQTGPLLAADGYGKLKLGMSEAEVSAQGVTLSDAQPGGGCTAFTARGSGVPTAATVVISNAAGLTVVTPEAAVYTAEGVGTGSTKDEVLAAYPAATQEPGGLVAPARGAAAYHFRLDERGVVQTSLASAQQDCAG